MEKIQQKYKSLVNIPSDINEHLPTLYNYACQCETIFETGVRGVISTWAFVNGLLNNNLPRKKIFLNDINSCDNTDNFHYRCKSDSSHVFTIEIMEKLYNRIYLKL